MMRGRSTGERTTIHTAAGAAAVQDRINRLLVVEAGFFAEEIADLRRVQARD